MFFNDELLKWNIGHCPRVGSGSGKCISIGAHWLLCGRAYWHENIYVCVTLAAISSLFPKLLDFGPFRTALTLLNFSCARWFFFPPQSRHLIEVSSYLSNELCPDTSQSPNWPFSLEIKPNADQSLSTALMIRETAHVWPSRLLILMIVSSRDKMTFSMPFSDSRGRADKNMGWIR